MLWLLLTHPPLRMTSIWTCHPSAMSKHLKKHLMIISNLQDDLCREEVNESLYLWMIREGEDDIYIHQDASVQFLATFSSWLSKQQCSPHIWDEEVPNSSIKTRLPIHIETKLNPAPLRKEAGLYKQQEPLLHPNVQSHCQLNHEAVGKFMMIFITKGRP